MLTADNGSTVGSQFGAKIAISTLTIIAIALSFIDRRSIGRTASVFSTSRVISIQELYFFGLLFGLNRPIMASNRIRKSLNWAEIPRIFVGVATPFG